MKLPKWMVGALILGSVFFSAILLVKPIGVSTQFTVLSGILQDKFQPGIITEDLSRKSGYKSSNDYYDKNEGKIAEKIKNPINYDLIFVASIPIGAFIGYILTKNKRSSQVNAVDQNKCNLKKEKFRTYMPSFIGGFLLLFGARMAGGCTSGHMMSGIMQGSVSGYIFAAVVFAIAIPTSIIIKKVTLRKGDK